MSDKNTVYEITELMGDKDIIKNDLNEAVNVVKDIFYQKYIQKFQTALEEHKNLAIKQSSKEIQLLKALRPFINENSHKSIDEIINIMYTLNTAKSIDSELKQYSTQVYSTKKKKSENNSETIHEDGIYEIDKSCNKSEFIDNPTNMTELVFMLLLSGLI